jgi:hypothetical protein
MFANESIIIFLNNIHLDLCKRLSLYYIKEFRGGGIKIMDKSHCPAVIYRYYCQTQINYLLITKSFNYET